MSSARIAFWQCAASNSCQHPTSNVVLLVHSVLIPVIVIKRPEVFVELIGSVSIPAALEARCKSDSSSIPWSDFSLISPAYIAIVDQIWR
ncbi:hypothetical protein B9Z55_006819 [Caenorhabditis nigoni]|uniref:Uncharacterized protein n=1 Tax=Caenorhabditis nigoni TaxID=1611254 RepID=A0A2G5V6S1_9PELO|nr:hypothetical protein B9Z55_006819 [Caenorhabditis nigoni]